MRNNKPRGKKQVKQQKVIYKGVYISNQRRKGNGGRIKCDQFQCKIQVMDFNPALHQSQIQWVQVRRYIKGQKRQDFNKKNNQYQKKFKNNLKAKDKDFKQKKDNNNFKQKKNQTSKQEYPSLNDTKKEQKKPNNKEGYTNLVKKFKQSKQKKLQTPQITIQTKQTKIISTSINQSNQNKSSKQQSSNNLIDQKVIKIQQGDVKFQQKQQTIKIEQIKENDKLQKEQRIGLEQDQQTQSQNDEDSLNQRKNGNQQQKQIISKKQETIILQKIKSQQYNTQKKQIKQKQQKKQVQQVIVARIIKQTKIVYKDKRFVAILTCQKRDRIKNSFIQKDIKPIDKIIKDYFLDVTPIHSRLPKMEFDNLVVQNIKVLTDYIQKIYPQKGKQLTKKKLNQILDLIQSIYVVASFGTWEGSRPYANIHQVIGKTMTIDGQCNCFLFEHHLNDFQYEQITQQKQNKKIVEICPSQIHKRFDKMVFTIDPSTSIDLDDAISIEKVNQDIFEIGIHISDVSQYLKYIDRTQLMKRTTSVYLPHKVFHMLTKDLMVISSLNPNVERLAFSIFVRMNKNGQLIGQSRLQKNIIKSRFKLSYQTVQDIITAKTDFQKFLIKHPGTSQQQFQILVQKLHDLTKIGLAHRQKRIKFQVFQNREISFELDQQRWPIDISVQSRYTSKKIVEQYMIIGNVQAATHLIKNFKQNALIIYHPKPSELAVKSFNQTFKFLDKKFEFQDIHKVQQAFLQIQNDKTINEQVKQFMYFKGRRVQQTAGYKLYHEAVKDILQKSQNKDPALIKNVHFALGQSFYTHFTSPMRRMADILVHESLSSLLHKTQPTKIPEDQIQKINLGRKHTKRLKKDLTQIYMCLMIYKTGKKILQDGIITSFGLKSVSIYIPYFDMMKQIMWRDELQLNKVSKNRQNQQILDVCIYYDKKQASRDVIWNVKKYQKVKLIIDCTKRPPLRLSISLEVTSKKGKIQRIQAYNPDF